MFSIQRFLKFSIVGASGVGVNMGMFWLLHIPLGLYDLVANPIAIEVSIITNFLLNDCWTWRDRRDTGKYSFWGRLVRYNFITSFVAASTDMLVLWSLTRHWGMNPFVAKGIGIGLGMMLNFTANHFWTFRTAT
ncbi:MAG: GtrA family protein [Gemmatimonadetes bacterium]|nr:MAG: GtrA family protein [Gemmatimonadota bacterium]